MKLVIFIVLIAVWVAWLCPTLVFQNWQHKATLGPGKYYSVLGDMQYTDSSGDCGTYYQIPETSPRGHQGEWTAFANHDPYSSFRNDGGGSDSPERYYKTEQEARNYIERWCKIN